jgi:hypothetical protein
MDKKQPAGALKVLRALRRMNRRMPVGGANVLREVTAIQEVFESALSDEEREVVRRIDARSSEQGSQVAYSVDEREDAMEDFTLTTALESLHLLIERASAIAQHHRDKLYTQLLAVYYAAEETLASDPNHPQRELLEEHIETMQRAHMNDYGRPIPPKQ